MSCLLICLYANSIVTQLTNSICEDDSHSMKRTDQFKIK